MKTPISPPLSFLLEAREALDAAIKFVDTSHGDAMLLEVAQVQKLLEKATATRQHLHCPFSLDYRCSHLGTTVADETHA